MRRATRLSGVALLALLTCDANLAAQSGGISGIVYGPGRPPTRALVYAVPDSGAPSPPVSDRELLIDQRDLRFVPSLLPVFVGETVTFRNSDPLLHNVFGPGTAGESFDLGTYPSGESRPHEFHRPGAHVILCHIHPEMEAWVVVIPNSYHTTTDADGSFRLEALPAGRYTLHVWHPRAADYRQPITVTPDSILQLEIQLGRRTSRLTQRTDRDKG